jgi:ribonuclease D
MSDKQVWEEASKLVAHPKVSQRVEELRAKLAAVTEKKELWNKEMSVKVLAQVALRSVKDGDRVRAIAEINKMHGWHAPTQHEVTGSIETVPAYDYSKLTDDVLKAILDAKTGPDTNS